MTVKANLPAHRESAASVVHEGSILVMGGTVGEDPDDDYDEDEGSDSVIVHNAETDTWARAHPLPLGLRSCAAITTVDGRTLFCTSDRIWQYDGAVWSAFAEGCDLGNIAAWGSLLLG